jgi:tight adherence protein C
MTASIAIVWGILVFAIISLCLSPYGARLDTLQRRISGVLSETKKADLVDEDLAKPLTERFIKPVIKNLAAKIQKYAPKSSSKNQQNEKLKKMLRQAGLSMTVSEYSLLRLLIIAGLATVSGIVSLFLGLGIRAAAAALFGAYAGFVLMRFHLTACITKRRKSMELQMPDVLDLLSINVEAGLGFTQALSQVIEHDEGPLIDELTVAYREMSMGRTRKEALALFAERCGLDEIKNFVGAIVQAEQLGISIKNVLRTQASAMRTDRRNKVEEKAMKTSVKILIPMLLFIFPVLFIVLMGPAAVKIFNQFKG